MTQNININEGYESFIARVRSTGPRSKSGRTKCITIPMAATAQIEDRIQVFYKIIKKGDEKNESEGKDKMV